LNLQEFGPMFLVRRLRRRHAWLLPAILLLAGVLVSASSMGAVVEADDLDHAPALPSPRPVPPPPSKDGAALLDRNIFCSTCVAAVPEPGADADPDGIVLTQLPIELLATSLATRSADSFATLHHLTTDQQGAYGLGDRVPGAGPLVRISGDFADFENPATGRVERVALIAAAAPAAAAARPAPGKASSDPFADRIKAAGKNRFEIEASLVKELTSNPTSIRGVRFAPSLEDGRINGFKLTYAAPNSIASALGMKRGDVIQSVNGMALSSPDALLEIYTRLRQQTDFSADVLRGGKSVKLSYTVR
jgi:general secretion pathway protein C